MRTIMLLMLAAALASCTKSKTADTVDSLVAHPNRLHEVERQCSKSGRAVSPALCNAASEARHRLFMGSGPQYTPPKDAPKF